MGNNKNELNVIKTGDGTFTIHHQLLDETYHSIHGALQESMHVYIKNGLLLKPNSSLDILEIGYGTGLNAALTYLESEKSHQKINYTCLEPFKLDSEILEKLSKSYPPHIAIAMILLGGKKDNLIHNLSLLFTFSRFNKSLQSFEFTQTYDIIYYDAFGPSKQPEMWLPEIFISLFKVTKPDGFLITYCAKGEVKRNLKKAGYHIKNLPGPAGKREITIAFRYPS